MKKLIAILLAAVLLLSLVACGKKPQENAMPEEVTVENPATYVSLNYGADYETVDYLIAYPKGEGGVHVEYQGDGKKVGELPEWVLHGMAAELAKTGIPALNGQDAYEEGTATASAYVEYADGTVLSVNYGGTVPQEFVDGYKALDSYFYALTASLPAYVPQPQILGEIDETLLGEITGILANSGIEALDSFTVGNVLVDESLPFAVGLSSADGITAAVTCAPMMMTTAYSLNIVLLEDAAKAEAVAADFEANLDWRKWVCVAPTDALVAVKDNMVLCLMAGDDLFTGTVNGITGADWAATSTLKNPDL